MERVTSGDGATPVRALGVRLAGELKDSGFAEQQWLVERAGGFVQVTELLYRVLEAMDGKRTLDQVAAAVSARSGWELSADDVAHLIEAKLGPAGLAAWVARAEPRRGTMEMAARRYACTVLAPLRTASGFVRTALAPLEAPPAARMAGNRSLLGVRQRVVVLGPELIERVTGVLQHLYAPPVLVAVMVLVASTRGWLYFGHGVAGGTHQVLYTPGLALAVVGLLLVSAVCHEFGHAAALRYGGGRVRGMGAGLYLVYPAFFTDVTDGYRLGRWARVRTDLGGFYFNLLFSLAVVALYGATGWDFLLLVVMLIDLEIVHQLLPLVRLDGYWLLADLTGMPDFLSLVGPYLRSALPLPWWKGTRLPPLRPWARLVFGAYVVLVIPLLAVLLVLAVKGLPRVLATALDALVQQHNVLAAARSEGDVLGGAVALLHVITLTLPVAGLLLFLVTLARRVGAAMWRWSRPTPARRLVGAVATVGAAAALALLWTPQTTLARIWGERVSVPAEPTPAAEAAAATRGSGGEMAAAGEETPSPTASPVTAATASAAPIAPGERGTLADALGAVVPTRIVARATAVPTTGVAPTVPVLRSPRIPTATTAATAAATATRAVVTTVPAETAATAGATAVESPVQQTGVASPPAVRSPSAAATAPARTPVAATASLPGPTSTAVATRAVATASPVVVGTSTVPVAASATTIATPIATASKPAAATTPTQMR